MATYQAKRIAGTIAIDIVFRLRALVYALHTEGYTLSGIHNLLDAEYQPCDIDKAYGKRHKLPRYMEHAGE